MVLLGIGLKFSTLPVLVVAVGIGVDYAFYIYARLMVYLRDGASMAEAYVAALRETGMAVIFTGLTLAGGAASWAFSGLKFQADMGLMLALSVPGQHDCGGDVAAGAGHAARCDRAADASEPKKG